MQTDDKNPPSTAFEKQSEAAGGSLRERVIEALRDECSTIFHCRWSNDVAACLARAAIAAMREPTNDIRNTYYNQTGHVLYDSGWEAVIDDVLKEG